MQKVKRLSQGAIEEILRTFGLTKNEAELYVFLTKHGVLRCGEIAKRMKKHTAQIYRILKTLQNKGLVESTLEAPARFAAVSLETIIDQHIKAKHDEAALIEKTRNEVLTYWKSIRQPILEPSLEKFVVIEGDSKIYAKISQMVKETKNTLCIATTVRDISQADQFGVFDAISIHPLKSTVQFHVLTELSDQNINVMKAFLKKTPKPNFEFKGRNPDSGLKLSPQMAIRDEDEILLSITPGLVAAAPRKDDVCLWTNCKSLVQAFTAVFEELWQNGSEIGKKIIEIETNKKLLKTSIINDAKAAEKKYREILESAKKEIITLTSSKGLIEYWKQMPLIEKWKQNGVSVKIMASILNENFEAANQLLKFCEIKHTSIDSLETTIVDGKYLFQFNTRYPKPEKLRSTSRYENTFFTNDREYVEKTRKTIVNIWKNALPPSSVTLESIIKTQTSANPLPENILPTKEKTSDATILESKLLDANAEKIILTKILNAQKLSQRNELNPIGKMYATAGTAIIHPPNYFNLPNLLILIDKVEKQSTFGAEDALTIFLWLKTPKGYVYVPVAQVGDNSKSRSFRCKMFAGTPAGENFHLVNKDEIQIRVHGNTMFAGWTKPIPLWPAPFELPPACILIEGYGDVKSAAHKLRYVSGYELQIEENYFDAFVTFFHQLSKYSGPGTDGRFVRDFIGITTLPNPREKIMP
jgi:HTH-type transcriptional regulator, sugar sensing transcriptional regulator